MNKAEFVKALVKKGIPKKNISGSIPKVSFPFIIITRNKPLPKTNFNSMNRYRKQYYTFNLRNVQNAFNFYKKPPQ